MLLKICGNSLLGSELSSSAWDTKEKGVKNN